MKISPQYLAGLIDGEGYLALLPSRVKGLKNPSFEPVIKIGMTGESILVIFNQLVEQYGGHIDKRKGLTKGNREAYTYILKSKKKVLNLLDDVLDYLIVKEHQAVILGSFCILPSSHTLYKGYDVTMIELKNRMYSQLKELKQPEPLAETN